MEHLRELLEEHCHYPQCRGMPDRFTLELRDEQPETGDVVQLWAVLEEEGCISSVNWEAKGSSLLCASCSILSESMAGRSVKDGVASAKAFIAAMTSDDAPGSEGFGVAAALFSVRHLPARVRCVTLPWRSFCRLVD
jgi:nitrogen fixation NifU-like protein